MLISAVGLASDSASRSSSAAAAAAARICTVCRSTHRFSLPSRVRALRPPVLALENRREEVGGLDSCTLGSRPGPMQYQIKVTNTGLVDSDDVVLGFLRPPGAGRGGVPLQQL